VSEVEIISFDWGIKIRQRLDVCYRILGFVYYVHRDPVSGTDDYALGAI
jgi:hypothetical protein